MKVRRFLIAKILSAIPLCFVIAFALIPWTNSAYAAGNYVPDVTFRTTNITLGKEIGLNFCFELADGVTADTVRATCGKEQIDYKMPAITQEVFVNGSVYNCYVITVKVAAKMMADEITIQLYNGTETVGESYTTSIKTCAQKLLTDPIQLAYHPLIKTMLNYGAAVQKQLHYNEANLANAGNELTAGAVSEAYAIMAENVNLPQGVSVRSVNVSYKSATALIVKLNGVTEGTSISCEGKEVKISTGANGVTVVEINGIMASEITKLLTLNVGSGTLAVSVSNYCYLAQNSTTAGIADVARALHAYGLEAERFA